MNLTLWIIASVLAAVFLVGAASKLFIPKDTLASFPGGGWVKDFSPGFVQAMGVVDLLAAVGLILPAALGIAPVLVPLAAVGIVLLMAGAVVIRVRTHNAGTIAPDLTYLLLASFVAVGRFAG
jgi:hypothetical protein